MSALTRTLAARTTGFTAVGVKELRGRMRGRRAFIFLTFYLVVLGGFAWMIELLLERSVAGSFGTATFASAGIGRGVFVGLLLVETLLVMFLAPAYTTGAISLEREKQTLDLLVATPISSLGIVLGKLISALAFVFILIISSIPLTALVFVFGGAGPEDVAKGYLILLVTAIGLGSIGLFCSSLFRRTQAATVVTYFIVLALTLGAFFVWVFWGSMTGRMFTGQGAAPPNESLIDSLQRRPPEALLWFNPFVSDADVMCGTETGFGGSCDIIAVITGRPTFSGVQDTTILAPAPLAVPADGSGVVGGQVVVKDGQAFVVGQAAPVQPFAPARDSFWPRAALAWIVLSLVLVALSVNMVSPTRRWHRPRLRRRSS